LGLVCDDVKERKQSVLDQKKRRMKRQNNEQVYVNEEMQFLSYLFLPICHYVNVVLEVESYLYNPWD